MYFAKPSLHPPVVVLPQHKAATEATVSSLSSERRRETLLAAQSPNYLEVPLTTVSLNSNFDAYIDVSFKNAPADSAIQLLLDSGNSVLVVPRWEEIETLANRNRDYQVLGKRSEPWGCPANVVRGPIVLATTSGETYELEDCVFYACTGDSPEDGSRTANFGAGCLSPWTASGWNTPLSGVTLQAPLAYNSDYRYVEFNYAPASVSRDQTAAGFQRFPECRSLRNRFRPGVNHFVSGLGVLRPERNQSPAHQRQRAHRPRRVLPDHRHTLGGCNVVARAPV